MTNGRADSFHHFGVSFSVWGYFITYYFLKKNHGYMKVLFVHDELIFQYINFFVI